MNRDDLRVESGHLLVRQGHYREALSVVKPLSRDPRTVPVRARAYVSLGEEKKALESYRKLIPERGLSREESLIVAYLEIRVGDRKRGVQTLESARAGLLETPRQVLAASLCYSLLGHPEEAVALIRESASRGLTSPSIYEELGTAASVLGDSLVAQWAFERLRELGRETSECLTFLATAELSGGDRERAIATLERAIRMNPKNGRALTLLGRVRYERGQLEMARETLQKAAACPETAVVANRFLAKVCRSLKLDAEAREAESRARSGRSTPAAGLTLFQYR
jgi:tetratricopeptide (TPR) repeat protein